MKYYKQTTSDNSVSYIASETEPSKSPSGYFTIETITKTVYDKNKYIKPEPTESEIALIELQESNEKDIPEIMDAVYNFIENNVAIPQPTKDKMNNRKSLRTIYENNK